MLPSTGYFKGISCPFYDSGLCERPYCHFRHVKKDSSANGPSDGIESGAILQKLVSAAVQKVLQQTEASGAATTTQRAGVEEDDTSKVNSSQSKPTYNPTPIAELNKVISTETENIDDINEQRKRHIPVPYTPRKPASLSVKRPVESNGSPQPFVFIPPPFKYTPGCTESVVLDPYTPKGSVVSGEKYLPGNDKELQEYTPKETQASNKHNYVPSDQNISKKKVLLEYKPIKVKNKSEQPTVTYQPTPKALVPCFSSDEDEPDPKKLKFSNDLNGLDDLGPEFDILDQILDEEKFENDNNKSNNEEPKNIETNDTKKVSEIYEGNSKKKKVSEIHKGNSIKNKVSEIHEDNSKKNKVSEIHEGNSKKNKVSEIHEGNSKKNKVSEIHEDNSKKNKVSEIHKENTRKHKASEIHKENNKKLKKSSHKSDEKKAMPNSEDKKSNEILNIENKDKSSVGSKTNSKSKDLDKKSHKSSSKDKIKEEKKERTSDKEIHPKNIDKSSKHSKHRSSKGSDSHSRSSSSSSRHTLKKKEKNDHHQSSKSSSKDKNKHDKDKHNKHKDKNNKKDRDKQPTNNNLSGNYDDSHDTEITIFDNNDEPLETSESDEESIALECKKIFEEYVPCYKASASLNELNNSNNLLDSSNETEYVPTKKRISRTADKNIKVLPREPLKKDFKVSAAQTMAERLAKVKEFHSSRKARTSSNEPTILTLETPKTIPQLPQPSKIVTLETPKTTPQLPQSSKIRIAHVPYASTMVNAKKYIAPITKLKVSEPSTSSTTIQTVKKGTQRIAHMPSEKFIDRPGVLEPLASKIPANIRSTYLNMMIDECLKIYLSATDAYARAQHEELLTSKKCSTVHIYKNSAVLAVSRLRKELQECNGVKRSGSDCITLQKNAQSLSGKTGNIGSWSIESKKTVNNSQEFTGAKFYRNVQKWILTEEQLQENGFPRPHASGEKGRAIIYGQNKQTPPKGLIRTCCRCKKDYIVDKKGFPAIDEECIYHPNNKYRVRGEAKYQCCSQDSSSDGCCVAPCHVYEYVDFDNLKGFIKTMPPDEDMDDYGIFSLDCEMCYTTHGLDLTRVTVINSSCKVVYETLIKPLHPIIDYNTRYSGITEEQMANVKTTLLEVQATLLSMFTSKTILVGHSLESDFKALKLIHDTVIDTSVLFPHKMGPPFKRALRNLSSEYLKKIIQNSVEGHDSAEDATVCMELLMYKLKEDLKTR